MEKLRFYVVQIADAFTLASICAGIVLTTVFFALSFVV